MALEERWPVLGRNERAAEWLRIWADLGRSPRTIDAYARGLAEYLELCERDGSDPLTAGRAQVAAFVGELTSRPSRHGANTLSLDSGAGSPTPRSSSASFRCACSTTSWSKKVFATRTRSAVAAMAPATLRESADGGSCRGSSSCRGSRASSSGWTSSPSFPTSRSATASCSPSPMTPRCAERSCARFAPTTSTRRTAWCGSGLRRPRPGAGRARPLLRDDGRVARFLPRAPSQHQQEPRPVVLVGVAAQPGRAAQPVDLVEGRAPGGACCWGPAVLHAHDAAPLL